MPAKHPNGARNETIRCEKCGENYAVTYKRCPFCEDDEPTVIFRRPKVREEGPEEAPRRRRPEGVVEMRSARSAPPALEDDPDDEYEELFRRRVPKEEVEAPRPVRRPRVEEEPRAVHRARSAEDDYEDEPPRRYPRQVDDDYEEEAPRRRGRRYEEDGEDDYEPPRRGRRDDDYDYDEDDDDYEPRRGRGEGGKRLVTNARGGGYRHRGPSPGSIIGAVLSILLVAAAIWIVFSIVTSLKGNKEPTPPEDTPTPAITASVSPTPSGDPNSQPPAVGSDQPTTPPVVTAIPDGQTATGFDLGKTEFTLSEQYPTYTFRVTFSPEGSTGSIIWSSSKPNIVSVDQNGTVTAVAQGIATITATMAGGYSKQCMVRCTYGGTPSALPSTPATTSPSPSTAPSASPSPSAGGSLAFNVSNNDFTLKVGETWPLKVKNATGAITWAIKDSAVATIDANGKVTGVAKGMTKATATVDGQTLECIVRVS